MKKKYSLSLIAGLLGFGFALTAFSCNKKAANNSNVNSDAFLSSEGSKFVDSLKQVFSCASITISDPIWDIDGTKVKVLELAIKKCSGDLAFDTVVKYYDGPNLIAGRIFPTIINKEKFDQVQLLISDNEEKNTCVYVYAIEQNGVRFVRSYLEQVH